MKKIKTKEILGQFVTKNNERYYKIENVDQMPPFFISVVSASDHWLFISSTGCLSAGRIRPENALFPYRSVDYIHENAENTGSKTVVRVCREDNILQWEPFNPQHDGFYHVQRNLYKNAIGNKILFEEINQDLGLTFSYEWTTSENYGFVRTSHIFNNSQESVDIDILDGIQNIQPSAAPLKAMQSSSALVDAYKWNELSSDSSLATFSLYAKLSDKAEPAESLQATSVFSVVNDQEDILISSQQLKQFRTGAPITTEHLCRGVRGAYFIHKKQTLLKDQPESWLIVADVDLSHSDLAQLKKNLNQKDQIKKEIETSIQKNQQDLLKLLAGSDAFQKTAEETTSVHHYANVLFNSMRGGVVNNQYWVEKEDLVRTLKILNKEMVKRHLLFFNKIPNNINYADLIYLVSGQDDPQLLRLCYEYLPFTFGRRHGDPSRPWNHFEIKLKDNDGKRLLSYQGNWRDIFQNWEALSLSYPNFIESFIAKFVNASTADGYNPYRITKEGIDWEIVDNDDPWSNIGYWGDHQIIYLLKFLELSKQYQGNQLDKLLNMDIFSYANIPYEICGVAQLFKNPKDTVKFNHEKQKIIEEKVEQLGSDGRLILDKNNQVYLVNLTEKLLVPLLAKLGNFVIDGGIWLNTQRPEWNDANNAIVGNGLSMVTLYYMRRYIAFMQKLLTEHNGKVVLSEEVVIWLKATTKIFADIQTELIHGKIDSEKRYAFLYKLASVSANYRKNIYNIGFTHKTEVDYAEIKALLDHSLAVIDASIQSNLRKDGLYNAYNILDLSIPKHARVNYLYVMLEGQVSVLSSGCLSPKQAVALLDHLYASDMYRQDQNTFMLYPDRHLLAFAEKNTIPQSSILNNAFLKIMIDKNDRRIVEKDVDGHYHFNVQFENAGVLAPVLTKVATEYQNISDTQIQNVLDCYEEVFHHQAFTGRSGSMFAYEGLGSIYWHMVSKLLLAVQENYFLAWDENAHSLETEKLADYYYKVRNGIGFNKKPDVYGAFPTDPYSHTPKQAGAQQPGMTGQVKEEIITRFNELGIRINHGCIEIQPQLLRKLEFVTEHCQFDYIDIDNQWNQVDLDAQQLGFTYCQIPFIYSLESSHRSYTEFVMRDGSKVSQDSLLFDKIRSSQIFARTNNIKQVIVHIDQQSILNLSE